MRLPIKLDGCPLPVSEGFSRLLNAEISKKYTAQQIPEHTAITFNFRDPTYSAEEGGYHPVEVRLTRNAEHYQVAYITDFSYVGKGQDAELAKEIDFDVSQGICEVRHYKVMSISEVGDFYQMFEANFISYYEMDVFEVCVTLDS
ncbi:DUF2787 family protein [Aliamphritea hakodatensis]|uniref:DUF2787 family protein n=1 Tax=Aliamphritea hakodatensis TaxID=2895352 RepID=UPI0022FD5161|nr:DUF2787 family protein [Aliamphritea hakodatensis]